MACVVIVKACGTVCVRCAKFLFKPCIVLLNVLSLCLLLSSGYSWNFSPLLFQFFVLLMSFFHFFIMPVVRKSFIFHLMFFSLLMHLKGPDLNLTFLIYFDSHQQQLRYDHGNLTQQNPDVSLSTNSAGLSLTCCSVFCRV